MNKKEQILKDLQEKHDFNIKKLSLKGKLEVEEITVKNNITVTKLRAEKEQLEVHSEIDSLKKEVTQDKSIKKSGSHLKKWSFLLTCISALLSISGLWHIFNSSYLSGIAMCLSMIALQFTVYIVASQNSNIGNYFRQHSMSISILKVLLLVVSIYGNYTFFTINRDLGVIELLAIFIICFCIDFASIKLIALSYDFKSLNKNQHKTSTGLISKLLYNITFKIVQDINTKYAQNKAIIHNTNKQPLTLVNDKDSEIELAKKEEHKENSTNKIPLTLVKGKSLENETPKKEGLSNSYPQLSISTLVKGRDAKKELPKTEAYKENKPSTFVKGKDLETVKNAIMHYADKNISPSITALNDLTGISKTRISEIKKELEKQGLIKTIGTVTYINEKGN